MVAQGTDGGAHPPRRFGPVHPVSQAVDLMHTDPRLCAHEPRAAGTLIRLRDHVGFQLWVSRPLIKVCPQLGFQSWAPSPQIWVPANPASDVCWGRLSHVHSPGAEGVEV